MGTGGYVKSKYTADTTFDSLTWRRSNGCSFMSPTINTFVRIPYAKE
jgi:hypothetical protein